MPERTIIDVGMHNGVDTDFYLKKGFNVIAIEANPRFVRAAEKRFADAIAEGRLRLIEGAITDRAGEKVTFYVNLDQDLWSAVDKGPGTRQGTRAEEIEVDTIRFEEIVEGRDDIYYIKCDIEHADIHVLRALRVLRRLPRFFSVEAHEMDYLGHLVVAGYNRFKLMNQGLHHWITLPKPAKEGVYVDHKFPRFSSGPFGEETPGQWQTLDELSQTWGAVRYLKQVSPSIIPGYFDYHAKLDASKDEWD